MRTLVTLLGGGKKDGYTPTAYQVEGGPVTESKYVGRVLVNHLRPDRLAFLGTSSSMWDVLVEDLMDEAGSGSEHAELRERLIDAVSGGAVDQALLDSVEPLIRAHLGVADLRLVCIPFGRSDAEQREILDAIAESAAGADEVHIDLTHGFRHLGMLGMLSAFVIERIFARVRVESLWYGAFEMETRVDRPKPVVRLDGLLDIQRWLDALNRFDASGDYGVFAPLLERDGLPRDRAGLLVEAAFLEGTNNVPDAVRKIRTVLSDLDKPLSGASALFVDRLKERLAWAEGKDPARQQLLLAHKALERGDYLRAAILGVESAVTWVAWNVEKSDHTSYAVRQQILERFFGKEGDNDDVLGRPTGEARGAFRLLRIIRNSLAHGTSPGDRVEKVLGKRRKMATVLTDRQLLRQVLEECLNQLSTW